MPATQLKKIDIHHIKSFEDLLAELRTLDHALPGSQLEHLRTFNSAYFVISSSIKNNAKNGGFKNPKFIETFTLTFASYYFRMINEALAGNSDLPVAWRNLLTQNKSRLPNFVYLLMGANAHINHDLSLVMLKMLGKDDTKDLAKDILAVDKILVKSGDDILHTFTETKKFPRFIKEKTSYIYLPITMQIILFWRIRAWKNYLSLKQHGVPQNREQVRGRRNSLLLLRLGTLINR